MPWVLFRYVFKLPKLRALPTKEYAWHGGPPITIVGPYGRPIAFLIRSMDYLNLTYVALKRFPPNRSITLILIPCKKAHPV